jgi:hypothetical protein
MESNMVPAGGGWAVISSLMMVGAVLVSLALGVLVAYGICMAMFRAFRVHAESAARERGERSKQLAVSS